VKLRGQLVALGLLTLAFPLAGWFLFQALHRDVQESIGRGTLAQARTLAASLQKNLPQGHLPSGFPVAKLSEDMQADGSDDDWTGIAAHEFGTAGRQAVTSPLHSAVRIGRDAQGSWWLWLRVFDASRNLPAGAVTGNGLSAEAFPAETSRNANRAAGGDRVVLGLVHNGQNQRLVFNRQPEGRLRAASVVPAGFSHWQGVWHELADGYVLEMRFPASLDLQRLGFVARDGAVWPSPGALTGTLSPGSRDLIVLWSLIDERHPLTRALHTLLAESAENPAQALVLDREGWVLASTPAPEPSPTRPWQWLQGLVYHWLFSPGVSVPSAAWQNQWPELVRAGEINNPTGQGNAPGVRWQNNDIDFSTTVLAQVPLGDGWLVLRQALSDEQLSLVQTLLRGAVIALGLIAFLLLLYLLYASFLAYRVRRLNQSLQHSLDARGRVQARLPGLDAGDEIGELARGLNGLLQKVHDHTTYLKGFGSRLSHELKTPLAMVQSSLDNLQAVTDSEAGDGSSGDAGARHGLFLQRAQEGTRRMRFILNQLSGLSRLQEALENTPLEKVDLVPFLNQYVAARKALIPGLSLRVSDQPLVINGSLDLLAQGLDKLLDNARDFTPEGGLIEVRAEKQPGPDGPRVILSVFNSGSRLPAALGVGELFHSLTSVRQRSATGGEQDSHHMGLGLYLLRLIVEQHAGQVQARNSARPEGVVFEVILPAIEESQNQARK